MARKPIDVKRAKQMEMLLTIEGGKAPPACRVDEIGKSQNDSKLKDIIYQSLVGAGLRQG